MKHMWSEEEIASQKKDIATIKDTDSNPYFMTIEGVLNLPLATDIKECRLIKNGNFLYVNIRGSHPQGSPGVSAGHVTATFDILPEWEKYFALDDNGLMHDIRLNISGYKKNNANNGTGTLYGAVQIDKVNHKLKIVVTGSIPTFSEACYISCIDSITTIA